VRAVCERLRELGAAQVESLASVEEGVHFALPAELRREQRSATPS